MDKKKKSRPVHLLAYKRRSLQIERHTQTASKWIGKGISCKRKQKKAGVVILLSDKTTINRKAVTKHREPYIMTKGSSTQQDDVTLVNICGPPTKWQPNSNQKANIDGCKVGEIKYEKTMVGDFKPPVNLMDRSSRQKINEEKWLIQEETKSEQNDNY